MVKKQGRKINVLVWFEFFLANVALKMLSIPAQLRCSVVWKTKRKHTIKQIPKITFFAGNDFKNRIQNQILIFFRSQKSFAWGKHVFHSEINQGRGKNLFKKVDLKHRHILALTPKMCTVFRKRFLYKKSNELFSPLTNPLFSYCPPLLGKEIDGSKTSKGEKVNILFFIPTSPEVYERNIHKKSWFLIGTGNNLFSHKKNNN